jgi:putative spermidine/putrescine transport system permease protein
MTTTAADTQGNAMVTADGTPLKTSLARALRRKKLRTLMLVAPLFLFILFAFFIPIGDMLFRSVENSIVAEILPRTVDALRTWDENSGELPDEAVFTALVEDMREGYANRTINKAGLRLNYEKSGLSSMFRSTARKSKAMEPPLKEAVIKSNKRWGDVANWRIIKRESDEYTPSYYVAALDLSFNDAGGIVSKPRKESIYLKLFWRTLWVSGLITLLCLVLAYPVAYLMSVLPARTANLLIILVLLPFWTSLLVRTTAWIALLQQEGVINDLLVFAGIVADDNRLGMIHNRTGTIIAMTHILLPFMILPLYSVMKTIPPSYMRAALSLGANPLIAFVRVYMPNTVAGIGAGSILVFILAIGYYITPALVGGTSGTLISNEIARHMSVSLNWGLAAALGALLLGLVLALYMLYDRIVGIDNMKLG